MWLICSPAPQWKLRGSNSNIKHWSRDQVDKREIILSCKNKRRLLARRLPHIAFVETSATGSFCIHTVSRAGLSMRPDTGWCWIRCYLTCPHSFTFLHCWVLHSIFLSTMYLFHYSLMTTRFMVSVLILLSFSRLIWQLVSFSPIQHTHEMSRPIWLQAAESAYRFTLGSIAGGEWHVCCRAPGPPEG